MPTTTTRAAAISTKGRFKSFPVQEDEHLLTLCRYVERNALRAGLAAKAEAWRWSSLWQRQQPEDKRSVRLSVGPVPWPAGWLKHVNQPQTEAELEAVRRCIVRGQPLGSESWCKRTATRLGLASTLRRRGRPKKGTKGS